MRLVNWRNTLANTFDNQERLNQLKTSQIIQISYSVNTHEVHSHPARQAIFLQAWLANQLKWKYVSNETSEDVLHINYQASKKEAVKIELIPHRNETLPSGELLEIDIACAGQHFFSIKRKEGLPQIVVHVSSAEPAICPL